MSSTSSSVHRLHKLVHHVRVIEKAGKLVLLRRLLGSRSLRLSAARLGNLLRSHCRAYSWLLLLLSRVCLVWNYRVTRFNSIDNVVCLCCYFRIFFLVLLLHPVEVSLLIARKFKKVDSVLRLLYLFKLSITWENEEAFNFGFLLSIKELELSHARCVFDHSNKTLSSLWLYHFSIVIHLASLEFHQRFRLSLLHEISIIL